MAMRPHPEPVARLVVDGRDVAPLVVASTRRARARGLLGRTGLDGALLLPRTSSVHGIGMRFPLDVALCTEELEVLAIRVLPPGGLVLPRRRVRAVLEAEAGSFLRWRLAPGAVVAVGGAGPPLRGGR